MMVTMTEERDTDEEAPHKILPPLPAEDDTCADCELSYPEITTAHAHSVIAELPARVRDAVTATPSEAYRQRPSAGVWSVAEYVCHLRDVYVIYTIRLHRTRTEDRPVLEPMLNNLRARRFRYNECDLRAVLDQLAVSAAGFCEEIEHTETTGWERTATRLPGEERTARWLVRQAMHEGVHHLADIRGVARAVYPNLRQPSR